MFRFEERMGGNLETSLMKSLTFWTVFLTQANSCLQVKNTGKERFYCLICDFNICYVCADKYTGNEAEAEKRWGPVIK